MVWVHFTEDELHNWLKDHGCEPVDFDDDCLEDHIMVYKGVNGDLVPIQIRNVYWGWYVTKVCTDLGIPVAHRFIRLKAQLEELRKMQAQKDSEKKLAGEEKQAEEAEEKLADGEDQEKQG